jgi:hypothetical protein
MHSHELLVAAETTVAIEAAIASLRAHAVPEGPKEVTVEQLADWFYDNGHELSGDDEDACRELLSQFTITPKVQS